MIGNILMKKVGNHMNITTKYEIGNIVYAVHPCQIVCNGQTMLNDGMLCMEPGGADQKQAHAEDIYIVCPHEIKNIMVTCQKDLKTEIQYELSNGIIRTENNIFASFEQAAEHAVILYGESAGQYDVPGKDVKGGILKEIVCKKLQRALKAVLSFEQLERFEEEFIIATQGLVFKEA